MSRKSTPISQIPKQEPIGRETDEQISFARGAQRAAEKFSLPQSSAAFPTDLVSDDDNTIKELLNKFNRSPSSSPIQLPSSAPQQLLQTQGQPEQQPTILPVPISSQQQQQQQQLGSPPHGGGGKLQEDAYDDVEDSLIDRVLNSYGNDMQLFVGFFAAYFIAGVIPLHSMFSRYVLAVEHIAFSDVVVRALAGAIVAYIVYLFLAPRRPSTKNA